MKQQRHAYAPFSPVDMGGAKKSAMRTQFGALCYRMRKGKPEILLVTSRGTKRWIIPKGWPMDGATPGKSAAREAWEEGGVTGKTFETSLGLFTYSKKMGPDKALPCAVIVYPLKVKEVHARYPERKERKRKWLKPADAAKRVSEPELAFMLRHFDPHSLTNP